MALWTFIFLVISLSAFNVGATENPTVVDETSAVGNMTLDEPVGDIKSPGYNTNAEYPHNANRWWTIKAGEGQKIDLAFRVMNVKNPFAGCKKDYVEVYTDPINAPTKHDVYCQNQMPPKKILSEGNEMKIHFVSDVFFKNAKGFWGVYQFEENGDPVAPPTDTPDDDYYDDDYYYDDDTTTTSTTTTAPTTTSSTTTAPTTTSSTTTAPTTTSSTTTTTVAPTTRSTTKKTTTAAPVTTSTKRSVIITKMTTTRAEVGETKDKGLLSGVVLTIIISTIAIFVGVILLLAYIRWRKQKKSQFISLRESHSDEFVNTDDTKQLVNESQGSIYKKQNGFIAVPQQDSFPL